MLKGQELTEEEEEASGFEQWQGEDGNTRYTTEVNVQDFTFLSTKKESMAGDTGNLSRNQPSSGTTQPNTTKEVQPVNEQEQDDDLPF